jgi:hypothetical protein
MKLSPLLCASVVALAAIAMSADSAFGGANDPIGGVGVGLGHKPNSGAPMARVTGPSGSIDFGVLPKGEYWVTLTPPKGASAATAGIKTADVTISGATAPVKASWNFETSRPFNPAASSTARAAVQDSVSFATDGTHHVVVYVAAQSTAVNTSRSNIKNNAHIYVTPAPTPVVVRAQSTTVNSSRSNIRNNAHIYVTPAPTPTPRN